MSLIRNSCCFSSTCTCSMFLSFVINFSYFLGKRNNKYLRRIIWWFFWITIGIFFRVGILYFFYRCSGNQSRCSCYYIMLQCLSRFSGDLSRFSGNISRFSGNLLRCSDNLSRFYFNLRLSLLDILVVVYYDRIISCFCIFV